MRRRFHVQQDLTVGAIERRGSGLVVHVADRHGRRHWISFSFPSFAASIEHALTVERWRERATRLTYVRGAGDGVLVDEEELFWAAFA